ncbi:TRAP transporter small permease [Halarsenatibacter silvermanii]|uniref:TRAP-type C4-dicarboxylate transport system, small permease component n=1 Tax=Halarsenatibacter silvermanii TaxID=321763 RepID=A0A1G9MT01_9FIRM|nr:TRAP transporter small permease [Halarsenatibacter silvermanii]SDL77422.1 TRAP-type C4-dicarboxylate transport system, small permease component [Halarsenatibacter silvermanii]
MTRSRFSASKKDDHTQIAGRNWGKKRVLQSIFEVYSAFIDGLNLLLKGAIILILTALLVVMLMQVFFRYVLFSSLPWSEEVARFLLIWLVMLASAYGFSLGEHIKIEFFKKKFIDNEVLTSIFNIVIYIILLFMLSLMVYYGYDLAASISFQSSPALRISMFWPTLALPLGGAFMMLQTIKLLLAEFLNLLDSGGRTEQGSAGETG